LTRYAFIIFNLVILKYNLAYNYIRRLRMKKELKNTLSKGVTAVLNRALSSSANSSSSIIYCQSNEPADLKKFKKVR